MSNPQLEEMNRRLSRMTRAVGSNKLSNQPELGEGGKVIMSHMLTSVLSSDFDPAEAKKRLIDHIKKAAPDSPSMA
jgi:hypothetical protein|tara:strand:+ start:81 stop:308 length:228 start_codon:yes stop_codon:yes gene_type:complete